MLLLFFAHNSKSVPAAAVVAVFLDDLIYFLCSESANIRTMSSVRPHRLHASPLLYVLVHTYATFGLGEKHLNFMSWLISIKLPTLSHGNSSGAGSAFLLWPNLRCFMVVNLYAQIHPLCILLCTTWVWRSRHQYTNWMRMCRNLTD